MSEQQENEAPAAPEVAETPSATNEPKKEPSIPARGGVEKKKRNRPPIPAYITELKGELADMKSTLTKIREEKAARRAEKEANRKKVHFEEPTQHQPEEEIVAEQDEEMSELEAEEVEEESESEEEQENTVASSEPVAAPNPWARKMSRILWVMSCLGDAYSDWQATHPDKYIVSSYPWVGERPHLIGVVDTVEEAFRRMRDIVNRDKGVPFIIFPLDVLRRT